MKRHFRYTLSLLLAVVLLVAFCLPAFGIDLFPSRNNSGQIGKSGKAWAWGWFYDLYVQDDLTVTDDAAIGGDAAVTGALTVTGDTSLGTLTHKPKLTTYSSADTLVATDTGGVIWITATGTYNLPAAAAGVKLTIFSSTTVNLNPGAADLIVGLTNAAGDSITSDAAYRGITLVAADVTNWLPVVYTGTWADAN